MLHKILSSLKKEMWIISFFKKMNFLNFFLSFFIYVLLERGREGEREEERHQCAIASHVSRTEDLVHNPGMCPDWESNQRPFDSQAGTQSTEPHQPGLFLYFFNYSNILEISNFYTFLIVTVLYNMMHGPLFVFNKCWHE